MPTATAQLDRAFHALADPSRRSIVVRLSRGPASVSELAAPLAMSLSAVMQHIDVLQRSGLVRSEKVGTGPHLPARARSAAAGRAVDRAAPGHLGGTARPARRRPRRDLRGARMTLEPSTTLHDRAALRAARRTRPSRVRRPGAEAALVREPGQLAERGLGARLPRRRRRAQLRRRARRQRFNEFRSRVPRHRRGRADRLRLRPAARPPADLGLAGDDRALPRRRRHAARPHRAGRVLRRPEARWRAGTGAGSCWTGSGAARRGPVR